MDDTRLPPLRVDRGVSGPNTPAGGPRPFPRSNTQGSWSSVGERFAGWEALTREAAVSPARRMSPNGIPNPCVGGSEGIFVAAKGVATFPPRTRVALFFNSQARAKRWGPRTQAAGRGTHRGPPPPPEATHSDAHPRQRRCWCRSVPRYAAICRALGVSPRRCSAPVRSFNPRVRGSSPRRPTRHFR